MNTKLHLLVIVILAIFSFSYTIQVHVTREKNAKQTNGHYNAKSSKETINTENGNESMALGEVSSEGRKEGDFTGMLPDDDGITHHFHLERVRQRRKYACLFCNLSKIIILLTHVALLICGYCHVIHH